MLIDICEPRERRRYGEMIVETLFPPEVLLWNTITAITLVNLDTVEPHAVREYGSV